MRTVPTRFLVPRSLLVSQMAPVPFGASFMACCKVLVKLGKNTASSSSTMSGRRPAAHIRQALRWEAQHPRSPGDIWMVLGRYQWNICAKRSVRHVFTTSRAEGGDSLPSTASMRCKFNHAAFLTALFNSPRQRSSRVFKLITTAFILRSSEVAPGAFNFGRPFLLAPARLPRKDAAFLTGTFAAAFHLAALPRTARTDSIVGGRPFP
mmetsp:Transcript_39635/g.109193  ORF Transcript_39635/g.109193 Transcript_39635/m.109193 type:complete len:208 (+) Transcript_39635:402-1025(+)